MIKTPRLKTNRHGVFSLRVYWRDAHGQLRESLHSLGTKNPSLARVLALQFNEAFERKRAMSEPPKFPSLDSIANKYELDLARGVMKAADVQDHERLMQAIEAYRTLHGVMPQIQEAMQSGAQPNSYQFTPPVPIPQKPLIKSLKFSEAIRAYLEEKKLDNAPKTLIEKGRTYKDFMEVYSDLEINLISKAEMVQWKTNDLKKGLSANRINKRLGQMNDFFNWAIKNGHYTAHAVSPCEGLFIGNKSRLAKQTENREPFSNDDLKIIFGSEKYLKKLGSKPDFYWIPLVALFTGARREEISSLEAHDVKTVDEVPCLFIQKGKTPDARRLLPLHPILLSLGFMDYAKHMQSMNEADLFPYRPDGVNGMGKNVGRQFSKHLRGNGITDSRKVMHSLRHTFITRMHATGANPAHVIQMAGHSDEMKGVHFQTYTHDVGLKALQTTLEKLVYPLNFDALRIPDPTFHRFLARWKMQQEREARRQQLLATKTKKKTD